jgi:hypothetical protein
MARLRHHSYRDNIKTGVSAGLHVGPLVDPKRLDTRLTHYRLLLAKASKGRQITVRTKSQHCRIIRLADVHQILEGSQQFIFFYDNK